MFDYLYTDLAPSHPSYALLQSISPQVADVSLISDEILYSRALMVSDDQESLDRAKRRGMGTAGIGEHLKSDLSFTSKESLRPHLSFINDSIEGCELFIFDMGNVVVKNINMLGKIRRKWNLPKEEFYADYRHYDFPLMEGTLSTLAYWEHIEHVFNVRVEGNPFAQEFTPVFNDEIVDLLKKLASEKKRVVCGSNTFAPHWDILERMGALALFDKAYASHELGVSKPSAAFFEKILEKEKVPASAVYFVDDYEENITTASSMGIKCLLYNDGVGKSASSKLTQAFTL